MQSEPHHIEKRFLEWLKPRPVDHYQLYREFLSDLPDPVAFWRSVSEMCATLKPSTCTNHFFGAVQYVVFNNPDEAVARYFPASANYEPQQPASRGGTIFWEFVRRKRREITEAISTREVQINKLGRLSLFAPLFVEISRRCAQPLAFIDIGCSIGLGLLWPSFRYSYGNGGKIEPHEDGGEPFCSVEGIPNLSLNGKLPSAAFLCGIEKNPLSIHNENDVRWLFALTAPGDAEGRKRLGFGLKILATKESRILKGCVLDLLPRLSEKIPQNAALVVYHSMTMHHLTDDKKSEAFESLLARLSRKVRLFEAAVEWNKSREEYPVPVELTLTEWDREVPKRKYFADADPSADGSLLRFLS